MSIDPLAFLADFQAEAGEHLRTLDEQLLRLERDPADGEAVRAMFLAAHSIKGGAAMLGLAELRELSHALEDVLGVLREARQSLKPAVADVLFQAIDQLRAVLARADGTPAPSTPETLQIVAALAASTTASPPPVISHHDLPRVLLVEDSSSVRQVETFLLEDAGFAVDALAGSEEALERARTLHYALFVVGLETREMRGPDLAVALREVAVGPQVPVLLTTTDYSPQFSTATDGLILAAKGKLGDLEFARIVRQLTEREAA